MNKHTRNTVLYSFLTISLVVSYGVVRQDSQQFKAENAQPDRVEVLEINEQATRGYELDSQSGTVLVSQYTQ